MSSALVVYLFEAQAIFLATSSSSMQFASTDAFAITDTKTIVERRYYFVPKCSHFFKELDLLLC
jgi:hypothetical protein